MRSLHRTCLIAFILVAALSVGCDDSRGGPALGDAGWADAGWADAGPNDAGPNDAGPNDAGPNDAGPDDACRPERCDAPPAPECIEGVRRTYAPATCEGGECVYPASDTPCPEGCGAGACLEAPCGLDERVEGGACVACEDDFTNEAGDDPAGDDTACDEPDACALAFGIPCDRVIGEFIKASNADALDSFGSAVALSGETLVVAAQGEDGPSSGVNGDEGNGRLESGAAYVFRRTALGWTQEAYLKASNAGRRDFFGESVDVDGDTLIVGAPGEASASADPSDNSAPGSGAAYVFVREGGVWREEAYIKSRADAGFGVAVAVSGETIAVGAYEQSYVDVFDRRAPGDWRIAGRLRGSDVGRNSFGIALSLDADRLAVGAYETGVLSTESTIPGQAYVFERADGSWTETARFVGRSTGDWFGRTVDLGGDLLIVGAPMARPGRAYAYRHDGSGWVEEALPAPEDGERFGLDVVTDGERIFLGVPGASSDRTLPDGGTELVREHGVVAALAREGGAWTRIATLRPEPSTSGARFGISLALDGNTLIVGAWGDNSGGRGVGADPTSGRAELSGAVHVRRVGR